MYDLPLRRRPRTGDIEAPLSVRLSITFSFRTITETRVDKYLMFSSRFMVFPTFLENNYFSFRVFFAFYAISNILKKTNHFVSGCAGGGGRGVFLTNRLWK